MTAPAESARTWEAEDYLTAVGRRLTDLPAEDRAALLEDLALHLAALADEDDGRPIAVRLGTADAYAAELRAAAGLPAEPTGAAGPGGDGLRQRVVRLFEHPWVGEVGRLLTELRPAWWVLRGYLLVLVPCLLPVDRARDFPVPAPLGSQALGVVLVLAAVTGSVALGRRALPRPARVLVAVGGVLLALGAMVLVEDKGQTQEALVQQASAAAVVPEEAVGVYPLLSRSGPVTDVFPYAADGTPLTGVLLYDQDGRPLQVGHQEWWADGCDRLARHPLAADGQPVPFSFPQDYRLDESAPTTTGACTEELPRPQVPLPVFPAADAVSTPTD